MSLLDDLAAVFGDIPRYIWQPIGQQESNLNPNSWANTALEDSRGIFQINLQAHPDLIGLNLFDPIINATIARDSFIGPAYRQALAAGITDPGQQAAYVWRYGIRPDWAGVTARGADQQLMADARALAAGGQPSAGGQVGTPSPSGGGGASPSGWASMGLNVLFVVGLVLLGVVGVLGLAKAFGAEASSLVPGGQLLKAVKG